MNLSPIILFTYSRLDTLQQTVEALKKNIYASESDLYIFSDGPKLGAEQKVATVRTYLKTIDGFKKIEIYESQTNMGLANSVIAGVTNIVNKYGKVIVIEDDYITSQYFLKFMNDSLDIYENEEKVACICGGLEYKTELNLKENTYFIRGADCGAWGTWKRAWDLFERDPILLKNKIVENNLKSYLDYDNSYPYFEMLQDQIDGKIDSWAIRWLVSAIIHQKLCLYPTKPLVCDIGFGVGATHTLSKNKYIADKIDDLEQPLPLRKINTVENEEALKEIRKVFQKASHYNYRPLIKIYNIIFHN